MEITLAWHDEAHVERIITVAAEPQARVADLAYCLQQASAQATTTDPATIRIHEESAHGLLGTILDPETPLDAAGIVSGTTVELCEPRVENEAVPQHLPRLRIHAPGALTREVSLASTTVSIGAADSCDITVPDQDLEPVHAWIDVRSETIRSASDAAPLSINGVETFDAVLENNAEIELGTATLTFLPPVTPVTVVRSAPRITHLPQPHFVPELEAPNLSLPQAPSAPSKTPFPIVMMIAPVMVAGIMFAIMRSPFVLMFAVFMPVFAVASYLSQRRNAAHASREALAHFDNSAERYSLVAHDFHVHERTRLETLYPAPENVWQSAVTRSEALWATHSQSRALWTARIGTGQQRSALAIKDPCKIEVESDLSLRLTDLAKEAATLEDAPVSIDLTRGAIGITGPASTVEGVVRALLLTLACTHSPEELGIRICAGRGNEHVTHIAAWLPHGRSPDPALIPTLAVTAEETGTLTAALEQRIYERKKNSTKEQPHAHRMCVFVHAPTVSDLAAWIAITREGPAAGITVVWWAEDPTLIPAACTTLVRCSEGQSRKESCNRVHGTVEYLYNGQDVCPVELYTLQSTEAEQYARALAPVADARTRELDSCLLPTKLGLFEAARLPYSRLSDELRKRWAMNEATARRRLDAVVGEDVYGPAVISLVNDGPHALVAGTTGSGKSELLRTWVLSLAAEYSPQALTFLFVDYKGGAAFQTCTSLPHCVGLVTDLSGTLVQRALTSLRAELHRRETILAHAGAPDLATLAEARDPQCPPALIIVIDEFAALAREVPTFVDELIDIAARGRSLGLHLILATQRPAGVVSDRIRANTSMRIALRLADAHDSHDVLGTADASTISPRTAGRAYTRRGSSAPTEVHVAYSGIMERTRDRPVLSITSASCESQSIYVESLEAPHKSMNMEDHQSDADRLVEAALRVMSEEARPVPRRPWLAPLHAHYRFSDLNEPSQLDSSSTHKRRRGVEGVAVGVVDIPEQQKQAALFYTPTMRPRVMLMGASHVGRTQAFEALLAAVSARSAHAYVIDSGGLAQMAGFPFVGAVVTPMDTDRTMRLFRTFKRIFAARMALKRHAQSQSFESLQTVSHSHLAPTVLVIESYAALAESLAPKDISNVTTVLSSILRDGASLGMSLIIGADRPREIPQSLEALIDTRLVFSLASDEDEATMGLGKVLSPERPCGRAMATGWGLGVERVECQVATVDREDLEEKVNRADTGQAVDAAGETPQAENNGVDDEGHEHVASGALLRPMPVNAFPSRLSTAQLPPPLPGKWTIGVDWDACAPIDILLEGTLLIVSNPTERQVAPLLTCAMQARASHRLIGLDVTPGTVTARLVESSGGSLISHEDPLPTAPDDPRPVLLLIPECSSPALQAASSRVLALIAEVTARGGTAIGEVDSNAFTRIHPVIAALAQGGRGVVQGTRDATVFQAFQVSATVPSNVPCDVPGRGWYVSHGKAMFIHIAELDRGAYAAINITSEEEVK